MRRRVVWGVVSCLMVLSLVLTACSPAVPAVPTTPTAPAAPTTPAIPTTPEVAPVPLEGKETVKLKLKKVDGTVVEKVVEKPRYGGWITTMIPGDTIFDRYVARGTDYVRALVFEEGVEGNWYRGMAGTGERSLLKSQWRVTDWDVQETPWLLDRWEWIGTDKAIFHINKNARFANIPPLNGRPVSAEDYAMAIERWFYLPSAAGYQVWPFEWQKPQNIKVIDKNTLEWTNPAGLRDKLTMSTNDWLYIVPKEFVQLYGGVADWRNNYGSGPFRVTDYVSGASITLKARTDYWRNHPLYPDMKMPFIDGVKVLVIPDRSTRNAAIITGKIDVLHDLTLEDFEAVTKANPNLQYIKDLGTQESIFMRIDKPELPWYDKKVRHALAMAIDRNAIYKDLYRGEATEPTVHNWPLVTGPAYDRFRLPFDKLPASSQELFQYKPEKAKQLLAEAGYPNGFKTTVVTEATQVDLLSIIAAYWKAIGVDLKIDIKERGVFTTIQSNRTYSEMVTYSSTGGWLQITDPWAGIDAYLNKTFIDTPETREFDHTMLTNFANYAVLTEQLHKFTAYIIDVADMIQIPVPYVFAVWQPWLRDYYGEWQLGKYEQIGFPSYIWIDQEMKKAMTGK